MKIAPVHLLSAVLRQHILPQKTGEQLDKQVEAILVELKKAPTQAEKLAILERLILRDHSQLSSDGSSSVERPFAEESAAARVLFSSRSNESISEMRTLQFSRQWEAESVIRLIMEHAQHAQPGDPIAGVAMPFKPSVGDMARAIEGLGYSSKDLFREDYRLADTGVDYSINHRGSLRALALVCLLSVFVIVFVLI